MASSKDQDSRWSSPSTAAGVTRDVRPNLDHTPSMNKYKRTCENCTVAKVKCEGHPICTRCSKRGLQCLFRKQRKRGRKSQYPLPRAPSSPTVQYTGMMVPAQGIPQNPHTPPASWPGTNPQAFLGMSSVATVSPNFNAPMMPIMPQYAQHAASPHLPSMSSVSSLNVSGMVSNAPGTAGPMYGYSPNQQNRVWLMPNQQPQPQASPQHVQGHIRYPIMIRSQQGVAHQQAQGQVPPEYGYISSEAGADSFKPQAEKAKESRLHEWQRRRVEALIKLKAKELNGFASELKKTRGGKTVQDVNRILASVIQLLNLHGSSQAASFVQSWVSSVTGEDAQPPVVAATSAELSIKSCSALEAKFDDAILCAVGLTSNWSKDVPAMFVAYETDGTTVTGLKLKANSSFHSAFEVDTKLYTELLPDWGADVLAEIFSSGNELVEYVVTAETKLALRGTDEAKERRFACMHIFECLWRSEVNVAPKPFKTLVRCGFLRQAIERGKALVEVVISFERVDGGGAHLAKRSKVVAGSFKEESPARSNKPEANEGKDLPTSTDIQWITELFETQLNNAATQKTIASRPQLQ